MSDEDFQEISLDFDGVKVDGFEPIPENTYTVRIAEVKTGISKAGNKKVSLTLEITEGEFEGRKLWETITFTEKAMWKVKQVLEAFTGEVWGQDGMSLRPQELVGYTARANVIQIPHFDDAKADRGIVQNSIEGYVDEDVSGGLSLT